MSTTLDKLWDEASAMGEVHIEKTQNTARPYEARISFMKHTSRVSCRTRGGDALSALADCIKQAKILLSSIVLSAAVCTSAIADTVEVWTPHFTTTFHNCGDFSDPAVDPSFLYFKCSDAGLLGNRDILLQSSFEEIQPHITVSFDIFVENCGELICELSADDCTQTFDGPDDGVDRLVRISCPGDTP